MAQNAKPAFDYKAHQQALALFTKQLEEHLWSFQTNSYYTLIQAQAEEIDLFKQAQVLGIQGVDEYIYHRDQALEGIRDVAFNRGMERQKSNMQSSIDYLQKKLEETRAKYMKPIDFFKEKLEKHDWYYSFSDDITVYRRGKAAEDALEKEAKEGGPEFQAEWAAACKRRSDNIRRQ